MTCNTGTSDRVIRVLLGLAVLGWGWSAGSWWGLVGLLPLVTGLTGFCGAYAMFHCATNRSTPSN